MKRTFPSYYPDFKCIASDCSDSCCIGWEIDIDCGTAELYKSQNDSFGERLSKSIDFTSAPPHFKLNGERCPFLNESNLCDIFINLGETSLCEICTEHPRFYEWFGDLTEVGLGLCCEAAGRLIFSSSEPAKFRSKQTNEPNDEDIVIDNDLFNALYGARKKLCELIQNRTLSISERVSAMLDYGAHIQDCIDSGDISAIRNIVPEVPSKPKSKSDTYEILRELISIYRTLDPIDPQWPEKLEQIQDDIREITAAADNFNCRTYEYEHLLIYFVYRYFLKATFDELALEKLKLAAASLIMVGLCDLNIYRNSGNFTLEDRIETAKAYSKEIEYSEENLQTIYEESYMSGCLQTDALISLFLQ